MIKCKKCNKPMRFVGAVTVNVNTGFDEIVGITCPDKDCKTTLVVMADEWVRNLELYQEDKK